MSNVFFFRLHKLRRQQEQDQERRQLQQQRRLSGTSNGNGKRTMRIGRFRQLTRPSIHCPSLVDSNVLTMVPGRLFERPATMDPSDSLDYIALQIPRYLVHQHFSHRPTLNYFMYVLSSRFT
jgi:hypothetical protein